MNENEYLYSLRDVYVRFREKKTLKKSKQVKLYISLFKDTNFHSFFFDTCQRCMNENKKERNEEKTGRETLI